MAEIVPTDTHFDVIGLGALNCDHWYEVPRIELDGEQAILAEGRSPGGSSANTVYALSKLGLTTAFLGVVGSDRAGAQILRDFQTAKVCIDGIARKRGKTGYTICLVDSLSRRSIYVSAGVNHDFSDLDVDPSWLRNTKVLHMSSFVHDAQVEAQTKLIKRLSDDVLLSFAPGSLYSRRGLPVLRPILARTDILFLNHEELKQIGEGAFEATVQVLHQAGCRKVVVTLGGSDQRLWFASNQTSVAWGTKKLLDALPIKDSTGAGDAFAAGFLYGMLLGKALRTCAMLGQMVAEFCLSAHGPRAGLPSALQLSRAFERTEQQDKPDQQME